MLLSYAYNYTQPSIYESYSIIKVKANKQSKSNDIINDTISTVGSKNVLEEISLLKTFKINKEALNEVDFGIRYFIGDNYKKEEIYTEKTPIKIDEVKILNPKIIGKMLTVIPKKNGFLLHYEASLNNKLIQTFFNTKKFTFGDNKLNSYDKPIKNDYFELTIKKKFDFTKPINFVLYGSKRDIFEDSIASNLDVSQLEKDTSLIKISFEDTIPKRANLYIDSLTKSFIKYSIASKNTQNNKTLNFITEELDNIKKELKASEEQLEIHQMSKNIVQPSIQATLYIQKLSNIEIEISENNLKKKLIENLINFVKHNDNLDAIAPSISKLDDQNTLSLITKFQDNQSLEEELAVEYTDEYPKLKTLRTQLTSLKHKIKYNLQTLKTDIEYKNKNLYARKISYEKEMQSLPSKERELVNIKRNYEVKSTMYEYLLKKKAENKIIQLATFSNYQIIDPAYNSYKPTKPKRALLFLLSIFLGLIVGGVLALIRHSKNDYIQNKTDIESITSLPLYGAIPHFKHQKYTLQVNKEAKSPFSESFRTLRTNLQFINKKDKGTIILLTSTIASEGKSTISANLATIMEMAKYKTIVINFDLRKPTLHKFFDVPNDIGVSDFLNGEKEIDEIISSTEFANLDIIPSGSIPSNPSELILSKKLSLLFEKLQERYEYIIIDTAPIGIVSDTKTLIPYADLNLIIVREDYAKKDFIQTLESMIERHNFKNVGLILNSSKSQEGEYGYGYSYEYRDK
jgi:capsular exopolysaccharide synthesis family protein